MHAYKVLRKNMCSLGLLGASRMRYRKKVWNTPVEAISRHPRKGGGLWVAPTLSSARGMQRYMQKTYGVKTRVFVCTIGKILHRTSCRIKTDKLLLEHEI